MQTSGWNELIPVPEILPALFSRIAAPFQQGMLQHLPLHCKMKSNLERRNGFCSAEKVLSRGLGRIWKAFLLLLQNMLKQKSVEINVFRQTRRVSTNLHLFSEQTQFG